MTDGMDEASRWHRYWRYLSARFRRDVADELSFHVEMRARQLEGEGFSTQAAHEEARRRFGDRRMFQAELERIERKRGDRMAASWLIEELAQARVAAADGSKVANTRDLIPAHRPVDEDIQKQPLITVGQAERTGTVRDQPTTRAGS